MKTFFIVVSIAVIVYATITKEQKQQALEKYNKECMEQTGISQEEVDRLRSGDFSNNSDLNQDYVFCMFRKMNIMSEDGVFDKDSAMEKLTEDEDRQAASDAIDACINERGSRPEENAFLMAKCYSEKNPGHTFL